MVPRAKDQAMAIQTMPAGVGRQGVEIRRMDTFPYCDHIYPSYSRAGGLENLNQGINIDFGAATAKVLKPELQLEL